MNILKNELKSDTIGITLVSLVVTIIILLVLAGISIVILGGENGLLSKTKQAKKAHIQSEMQEQLTLALNELQVEKNGSANLEDISQEWINSVISSDYNPTIKEDASLDGKLVVMNKSGISGKFLVNQNLEISKTEYNISSLEFEYETGKLENRKVKILIKVTDKVNGITQIDYPDSNKNPLIMQNRKDPVGIDYSVELGKEYKFVITTGDGIKIEKIIKIDDYYYNITKDFGENAVIDNKATKAAYGKAYEAAISAEGNYVITGLTVTMGEQNITTSENNVVDIDTGKIKIEKVTGDIDIKVTTKKLEIKYTAVAVSGSNSANTTYSLGANTQNKGTTLYINIIATLEGNKCTVVSITDNSKTVPYAVTENGKYIFKVSGTYNGKTVEEEKDVLVNQYISAKNIVKYDAGEWTKDEIEELKSQNLYMINKEKTRNSKFNLNDKENGLNFTFGGFTYKEDTENEDAIIDGTVITSRNQGINSGENLAYDSIFDGWQLLNMETKNDENGNTIKNSDGSDRIFVTKIVHSGTPELFVFQATSYYISSSRPQGDGYRAIYLLSGGKRENQFNTLGSGNIINPRKWDMYIDKNQESLIDNVHCLTREERWNATDFDINGNDFVYWFANAGNLLCTYRYNTVTYYGEGLKVNSFNNCKTQYDESPYAADVGIYGIRPVVEMVDGVYIKSGTGTESDPYILGKD